MVETPEKPTYYLLPHDSVAAYREKCSGIAREVQGELNSRLRHFLMENAKQALEGYERQILSHSSWEIEKVLRDVLPVELLKYVKQEGLDQLEARIAKAEEIEKKYQGVCLSAKSLLDELSKLTITGSTGTITCLVDFLRHLSSEAAHD